MFRRYIQHIGRRIGTTAYNTNYALSKNAPLLALPLPLLKTSQQHPIQKVDVDDPVGFRYMSILDRIKEEKYRPIMSTCNNMLLQKQGPRCNNDYLIKIALDLLNINDYSIKVVTVPSDIELSTLNYNTIVYSYKYSKLFFISKKQMEYVSSLCEFEQAYPRFVYKMP